MKEDHRPKKGERLTQGAIWKRNLRALGCTPAEFANLVEEKTGIPQRISRITPSKVIAWVEEIEAMTYGEIDTVLPLMAFHKNSTEAFLRTVLRSAADELRKQLAEEEAALPPPSRPPRENKTQGKPSRTATSDVPVPMDVQWRRFLDKQPKKSLAEMRLTAQNLREQLGRLLRKYRHAATPTEEEHGKRHNINHDKKDMTLGDLQHRLEGLGATLPERALEYLEKVEFGEVFPKRPLFDAYMQALKLTTIETKALDELYEAIKERQKLELRQHARADKGR